MPITLANVLGFIPTNLWSTLKKFIKTESTVVYDVPFKLITKYTPALLVVMMCLSFANQFVRNVEIDCIARGEVGGGGQRGGGGGYSSGGGDPELNDYCWNYETFLVAKALRPDARGIVTYPGISGYKKDVDELIRIKYYKQVWLILGKLAVLAFVPLFLWKLRGTQKIRSLIDVVATEHLSEDEVRVNYFIEQAGFNGGFAFQYLLCKLLAAFVPVAHWYYLCGFIGHLYAFYGIDVLSNFMDSTDPWPNPMDALFPKVAKCEMAKYGYSGDIELRAAQCQLPMNNLTQWSFFIYWWWLALVFVINFFSCIQLLLMLIPYYRNLKYKVFVSKACREDVETARTYAIQTPLGEVLPKRQSKNDVIVCKLTFGDWLVLNFMKKNLQEWQFRDLVRKLALTNNHVLQLKQMQNVMMPSRTEDTDKDDKNNGQWGPQGGKPTGEMGFISAVLDGQVVNPPVNPSSYSGNETDEIDNSASSSPQFPVSPVAHNISNHLHNQICLTPPVKIDRSALHAMSSGGKSDKGKKKDSKSKSQSPAPRQPVRNMSNMSNVNVHQQLASMLMYNQAPSAPPKNKNTSPPRAKGYTNDDDEMW